MLNTDLESNQRLPVNIATLEATTFATLGSKIPKPALNYDLFVSLSALEVIKVEVAPRRCHLTHRIRWGKGAYCTYVEKEVLGLI